MKLKIANFINNNSNKKDVKVLISYEIIKFLSYNFFYNLNFIFRFQSELADTWAVGCNLLALINGALPFNENTSREVIKFGSYFLRRRVSPGTLLIK